MKVHLSMTILWSVNFTCLLLWAIVSQIPSIRSSKKNRRIIFCIFGIFGLLIFINFHFILGLSWNILLVLLLFYNIILVPLSLPGNWILIKKALVSANWNDFMVLVTNIKVNKAMIVSSWFLHSLLFIVIALLLKSPIWLVGATIIMLIGFSNIYFEFIFKNVIQYLNPRVESSFFLSGFVLIEELPVLVSSIMVSYFFFPLLYFVPFTADLFQAIMSSSDKFMISLALLFVGPVAPFLLAFHVRSEDALKSLLTRLYIGIFIMLIIFFGFISVGFGFIKMGNLNLKEALSSQMLFCQFSGWPTKLIIANQIWFAATLIFLMNILSYNIVTLFLVMKGHTNQGT